MADRTWPTLAGNKAFVNNYSAKNHARPFSIYLRCVYFLSAKVKASRPDRLIEAGGESLSCFLRS